MQNVPNVAVPLPFKLLISLCTVGEIVMAVGSVAQRRSHPGGLVRTSFA